MKDPDFMAAFNNLKKEQRDRLEDEFFDLSEKAAGVIRELLETTPEKTTSCEKKLDPIYGLKVRTALRILDMESQIQARNSLGAPDTSITARATVPEGGRAIAFAMAEKNSPESV